MMLPPHDPPPLNVPHSTAPPSCPRQSGHPLSFAWQPRRLLTPRRRAAHALLSFAVAGDENSDLKKMLKFGDGEPHVCQKRV